jgi:hypothetical protein
MGDFKILGVSILSSISASVLTHPIDVLKVRLQSNVYNSKYTYISELYKKEGFFLYKGLSASFLRNGSFVASKMFVYNSMKNRFNPERFHEKLLCGITAGIAGSSIGTPFDVVMVKIQNNPTKTSIVETVKNIYTNNGFIGFWKGLNYTMTRAIIVTSCQFSVYEQIKEELNNNKKIQDTNIIFGISSISSSLITSFVSNPVDLCKNRTINGCNNASVVNIVNNEGFLSLWKGLTINTARQIPLNLIRFSLYEFYNKII